MITCIETSRDGRPAGCSSVPPFDRRYITGIWSENTSKWNYENSVLKIEIIAFPEWLFAEMNFEHSQNKIDKLYFIIVEIEWYKNETLKIRFWKFDLFSKMYFAPEISLNQNHHVKTVDTELVQIPFLIKIGRSLTVETLKLTLYLGNKKRFPVRPNKNHFM